ncbi:MAG: hypothetical protein ACI9D8_000269 [Reinekea sp.]|jgi:hypothetical protein
MPIDQYSSADGAKYRDGLVEKDLASRTVERQRMHYLSTALAQLSCLQGLN